MSGDSGEAFDNIPPQIWDLTRRKLYKNPQHPLATLIEKTDEFFQRQHSDTTSVEEKPSRIIVPGEKFKLF
jgi:hypothetical protein